ncbi:hypothetical protein [Kitasatospora purpeofusca]|uniref:Uncharacterized protein n=1 Tax=Kitasatospora purpeofusca TaxID=67352 RepID=A0ABZ1U912_9ACTN|nr:hypothetical protein [Kitasatospora purpeofusca]
MSGDPGATGDHRRVATAAGPAATKGSYNPSGEPGAEPKAGSPTEFFAAQDKRDNDGDHDAK